jgi:hypothetical protein
MMALAHTNGVRHLLEQIELAVAEGMVHQGAGGLCRHGWHAGEWKIGRFSA